MQYTRTNCILYAHACTVEDYSDPLLDLIIVIITVFIVIMLITVIIVIMITNNVNNYQTSGCIKIMPVFNGEVKIVIVHKKTYTVWIILQQAICFLE